DEMPFLMETRYSSAGLRAVGHRRLTGVAAPFNVRAKMANYFEVIAPSAFERSLREGADVRALFNHSPNQILGRVSGGTLRLTSESDGLHFEISLPNTSLGRDVHTLVSRRDLSECSFAFECRKDTWSTIRVNGKAERLRMLEDVSLADISVVTYPAYSQGTSVNARSAVYGRQPIMPKILAHRNVANRNVAHGAFHRERERLKLMVRFA